MRTPSPRMSGKPQWLFKIGKKLDLCGQSYRVKHRAGRGGFGELYVIEGIGLQPELRVVKFLRGIDDFCHNESIKMAGEITARLKLLFQRESKTLQKMAKNHPKCFPAFYGEGEWNGRLFYIMESLSPVSVVQMKALATDAQRMHFIGCLCDAVAALHAEGLVHYDIKPQNILIRESTGECVLGDFGSVHREESHHQSGAAWPAQTQYSLSMLTDGRRIAARTVGYCDPIDSLHTRHADIYAIGQVIRDMFANEVPALWGRIILKCINRNFGLRYASAEDVRRDIMSMGNAGASQLAQEISSMLSPDGAAWVRDRVAIHVSAQAKLCGLGTAENPFRTISEALKEAPADSVILVGHGIYDEVVCLEGRKVDLVAVDGPQETMIRGRRGHAVIRIAKGADGCLVKGFTLTGGTGRRTDQPTSYGYDYYGGGVNVSASATLEDCVIVGNGHGDPRKTSCTFGGGVCVSAGTVILRNCRICDNYAWASGGGLMADGRDAALVVVDCTIEGNDSSDFFGRQGGISLANSATLSVSGCFVSGNGGDQVGAFGNVYANGTRAQVERSYVEGGARACNIPVFIARPDNYKVLPQRKGVCGCGSGIKALRVKPSDRKRKNV